MRRVANGKSEWRLIKNKAKKQQKVFDYSINFRLSFPNQLELGGALRKLLQEIYEGMFPIIKPFIEIETNNLNEVLFASLNRTVIRLGTNLNFPIQTRNIELEKKILWEPPSTKKWKYCIENSPIYPPHQQAKGWTQTIWIGGITNSGETLQSGTGNGVIRRNGDRSGILRKL